MDLEFVYDLPSFVQYLIFIIAFVIGAVALIGFCNIFIDNASLIAKKFRIPPLLVGLTIVAMGTSIPEIAVSISDSIQVLNNGGGYSNIALGNVVGSNIANILLVISLGALFTPIIVKKETKKELYILMGVTSILVAFCLFFGQNSLLGNNVLKRWESIILLGLAFAYLCYIIASSKEVIKNSKKEEKEIHNIKLSKCLLLVFCSVVGIAIGGELVVYGARGMALNIATALSVEKNLAESLIGLTIVAVGTSLPELVTTFVASKKGQNDMAIGNVVGSNIFNIILVLGVSGSIIPIAISSAVIIDLLIMFVITIVFTVFALLGKFDRKHSIVFMSMYLIYLVYLILRTIL